MNEIQPGQFLSGTVLSTDLDAGLLVEVAPRVNAIVPVLHMSDLGKETARKKFKVRSDQIRSWSRVRSCLLRLAAKLPITAPMGANIRMR